MLDRWQTALTFAVTLVLALTVSCSTPNVESAAPDAASTVSISLQSPRSQLLSATRIVPNRDEEGGGGGQGEADENNGQKKDDGLRSSQRDSQRDSCTSLERCFSKADMQDFYDIVIGLIGDFSRAVFGSSLEPRYVYVESGSSISACSERIRDSAFLYCGLDRTVYVGQGQLWTFYDEDGDAAAAAGIAHEWGHHLQNVARVVGSQLQREQQADCVAGSWLAFMAARGTLERGDIDDVRKLIRRIASAETGDRSHGTLQERSTAFGIGYSSGIRGCNRFSPLTPLVR